ncbi:sulfotransferase domain-containing protein [Methylonatrum kenyense]|uniref:sulfotransferase domain-containing protein n=1 Tax=Methylonatrum kenyense TaxID=455253 RepID=UPI0020C10723|nr:sulfotransferase domain-containing protein [Methylonatrum kenyense]MCK8517000.1 sulfotransferase domain-containing protein [Methylonatrum kenyense]
MNPLRDWRNMSEKQRLFTRKSHFIVSIPKSGRTWLRVFLHAYYSRLLGSMEPPNSRDVYADGRPAYQFTHDRYSHLTIANPWQRLIGRYLIPPERRRNARILLLARDPRDLMVSLYFQNTRRVKGSQTFHGSIDDMLNDKRYGVDRVIKVMNGWLEEWGDQENRLLLCRYEAMHQQATSTFSRVIEFLGNGEIDQHALDDALGYSRFDNMQAREKQLSGNSPSALRPGNADDPESFKARKGRVGGYLDYLTSPQVARIEQAMENLDHRFDYATGRSE